MQRKYLEMRIIFTPGISHRKYILAMSSIDPLAVVGSEAVGSFVTMTVLARTTFTHKITLKEDLIQQVTI